MSGDLSIQELAAGRLADRLAGRSFASADELRRAAAACGFTPVKAEQALDSLQERGLLRWDLLGHVHVVVAERGERT